MPLMHFVELSGLTALLFIASCMLNEGYRRMALRRGIMDVPNARSSHATPVPRGGGVAIVLLFSGVLFSYQLLADQSAAFLIYLPAIGLACVGFLDDHSSISASLRLLLQCLMGIVVIALLPEPVLPVWLELPFAEWLLKGTMLLYLLWLLNLYNFMDGIDGLAAVETLSVSVGALLILMAQPGLAASYHYVVLLLTIVGATAGFLVFNWSPAKLFLGDVGSLFIGLLFGILSLQTAMLGLMSLWCWLILLAVFVADASLTLARRILRAEHIFQAHRQHLYQHLALRWGHARVSLGILLINCLWLIPLAWLVNLFPSWGFVGVGAAYLPLILIAIIFSNVDEYRL